MSEFNIGQKFEMEYPFYKSHDELIGMPIDFEWLVPGCHRGTEIEDWGYGDRECVYWVANYLGKVCYEILAIAEMPGKYMNRVIIKCHYIKPDGEAFSAGKIKTLTTGKLKSQIDNNKVFPCDYELDEDYK